jgi:intracellular multiplication protein IcmJ
MALEAITLSIDVTSWARSPKQPDAMNDAGLAGMRCAFCGLPSGKCQMQSPGPRKSNGDRAGDLPACPLCALPQHLERSRIDEEATLVWLPEMSQQAINAMMREIHIQIRALGEDLQADSIFKKHSPSHRSLHYARAVLAERIQPAIDRIGTNSAHELGIALLELSPAAYARRAALLGGLRLMPLGRFFDGDRDVYPEIVDSWMKPSDKPGVRIKAAEHVSSFGKG